MLKDGIVDVFVLFVQHSIMITAKVFRWLFELYFNRNSIILLF